MVGSYLITHLKETPVLVLDTIGPPCTMKHPVTVSSGADVVMTHSTGCKSAFGTLGFKSWHLCVDMGLCVVL